MIPNLEDIKTDKIITGIEGAGEDDAIFVSFVAVEKIIEIKKENEIPEDFYLRLATRGGGCSGMNYSLGFDDVIHEDDLTYKFHGIDIVVDKKSIFYMMGVTLDFIDGPHGSGFVFNSPFNEKTCGCSH